MTTEFSVLLAVYHGDRSDRLRHAFTSTVQEQDLAPAEVVLVQDGPVDDDLAACIAELEADSPVPVTVVALDTNRGLAAALNEGLEACRYPIVARMDADDVSLPHRFRTQVERLVDEQLDLIGGGMYEFGATTSVILARRTPPVGEAEVRQYARFHDPFNHPTVVFRKDAVARVGGYQPLGRMEDYWLFARMLHDGARMDNVAEPVLMYRVDDGAYARRGGFEQLRTDVRLQFAMRRIGFTTTTQFLRNLLVRGGYRLLPEGVRRPLYRVFFARRRDDAVG